MLRKKVGDGIITRDAVFIFQHIVTFIFKNGQFDLFALGLQFTHQSSDSAAATRGSLRP